ncbi:type II toxin-antitoxin system RelE/ParE family toxin [Klebsiella pneumoniae]|uniref:type II toxin-antitoxin system RelE/ParE family toxin n=1 Tax=Klebsiella pneumoniae TaxID=573 RepID=UPI001FAC428D|nr:type II toxin-antitoxin system RelE/ParE family toxin [Klebsiella pneumoniae]MCI8150761.1 type II toxin-antitoxin system RelE/ParE family toxin [Klebsiella pneumoniae]
MPQVTISALAQRDLQRLQDFLKTKNRLAARKAGEVIVRAIQQLKTLPDIGRRVPFLPLEYQELVIGFGDSGYVMLYRHDREMDRIVIVTVSHQKESGYPGADSL